MLERQVINKKKELMFVLGLGAICGYYGLTCFIFILAFLTNSNSVTIHLNIFGELMLEFVITLFSIPCAIYTVKEAVRLKKLDR